MLFFPSADASLLSILAESALLSPPQTFTEGPFLYSSGPPGATSNAVFPQH